MIDMSRDPMEIYYDRLKISEMEDLRKCCHTVGWETTNIYNFSFSIFTINEKFNVSVSCDHTGIFFLLEMPFQIYSVPFARFNTFEELLNIIN